jgi:dehydrogenase/reductase SDR family protein 12
VSGAAGLSGLELSVFANGVDAALEWSVVGSFTRLGAAVRERLDHWAPLTERNMRGRVIVITGATSGLGLATAQALAQLGATIEIIARNAEKAASTCAALRRETGNPNLHFVHADSADLAAIRRAAAELMQRHPAIHVLIHNAGALDDVRHLSPEGIELTVASQVVGPFLLTGLLLPALRAGAPSRVLWVSSGGMYGEPLAVDRLEHRTV